MMDFISSDEVISRRRFNKDLSKRFESRNRKKCFDCGLSCNIGTWEVVEVKIKGFKVKEYVCGKCYEQRKERC